LGWEEWWGNVASSVVFCLGSRGDNEEQEEEEEEEEE
jgi:hypothetical protein